MQREKHLNRRIALLLALCLATAFLAPAAVRAQEPERKVIRVGWFDSSFNYWDSFGRRCGTDYEYQQRISAYTGWTYEYIEDSWPNLLKMLMNGEIDLLSDVSYKEERTEYILYPDLPMGTETYYIYISGENREITADNPKSLNGKRVGVNQGSVQEGFMREWAEKNGLEVEIVPLTTSEDESTAQVMRGTIDGFASIFSYGSEKQVVPAFRIGASDYYYAVSKSRPELLPELNMALAAIHDEDPYFNERLSQNLLNNQKMDVFLTPEQDAWIAENAPIRVGYADHYMPFCETDAETGALTGALEDFLSHIQNRLGNSDLRFETKAYPSVGEALSAMQAGEIDCVFPVYLNDYDAVQTDVRITNPAMKTGMNAIMRQDEDRNLTPDNEMRFAIPRDNPNLETFIRDQYPNSRILVYESEKACYEAVAGRIADCMLISNYRIPAQEETIRKHKLYHVPTGEHIPFSLAVRRGNKELYFLLNKAVLTTNSEDMDSALASYMHISRGATFAEFIRDNGFAVIGSLVAVFAVIIALLLLHMKTLRKAHAQEKLLAEAAEIAELKQTITSLLDNIPGQSFTKDANTGIYLACNQAFAEEAGKKSPDEVVGRTDAELFDAETAKRYVEDDKMTLSMDEPYIYFEDRLSDAGETRQVKIIRRKYTDANGRECVLGVFQDVTDNFRIRRMQAMSRDDYEKARGAAAIYTHLAQALARGYEDLYYVDLNTEEYIQYRPDAKTGGLTEVARGWHFFEFTMELADQIVWPEDREKFKKALDRKALIAELERDGTFRITYRLIGKGDPVYQNLKVTRMRDDDRHIVMGVTNIDEEVKQRNAAMQAQEEQIAYNRLKALAGELLSIYVVDPETGRYREFTSGTDYHSQFAQTETGEDFFTALREGAKAFNHPEDLNRFLEVCTMENVLADIERNGVFTVTYRVMVEGLPRYVQLKAGLVEEKEKRLLIVGLNDIDTQVRQEENYVKHLARAQIEANVDALTGIKNRHAYLLAEERLNAQLVGHPEKKFAVTILDVNDLKKINDVQGHNAGDEYLREACKIICRTFRHSPVFRIGGDEFAVLSQSEDYDRIDELIREMNERNREAIRTDGIVIACGMAKRRDDDTVAPVFERADRQMYDDKSRLKSEAEAGGSR